MSNSADVMAGTREATTAVPITAAFRKLVIASSLGSVIEHYDFFIYAFTAPVVFDRFFFPKMDSTASMLACMRRSRSVSSRGRSAAWCSAITATSSAARRC